MLLSLNLLRRVEKMQTSNYNSSMFEEEVNLITLPKRQKWTGAQIHHFINDVQQQYEVASHIDIPREASAHYRDLLVRLIKTYGH